MTKHFFRKKYQGKRLTPKRHFFPDFFVVVPETSVSKKNISTTIIGVFIPVCDLAFPTRPKRFENEIKQGHHHTHTYADWRKDHTQAFHIFASYKEFTQGWKQNSELLFLQNCSITKVPSIRYFPFYFFKKTLRASPFSGELHVLRETKESCLESLPSGEGGHKIRRDKGTYKEEEEEETVGDKNKQHVGRDMDTLRSPKTRPSVWDEYSPTDSPKWWKNI